jgi:hypothetical protein
MRIMPQLVKGGKHVFAWITLNDSSTITLPPEIVDEYEFKPNEKLVLMPGSRKSGGFSIVPERNLTDSPLNPLRNRETVQEDQVLMSKGKPFIVTRLGEGNTVAISKEALDLFGVEKGAKLLAVRGSGLGPGFVAKGPIMIEAFKHPEIEEY